MQMFEGCRLLGRRAASGRRFNPTRRLQSTTYSVSMSSFEEATPGEVIILASDDLVECATSCEDPYVRPREVSSRSD
jgi:hypothetical protein